MTIPLVWCCTCLSSINHGFATGTCTVEITCCCIFVNLAEPILLYYMVSGHTDAFRSCTTSIEFDVAPVEYAGVGSLYLAEVSCIRLGLIDPCGIFALCIVALCWFALRLTCHAYMIYGMYFKHVCLLHARWRFMQANNHLQPLSGVRPLELSACLG